MSALLMSSIILTRLRSLGTLCTRIVSAHVPWLFLFLIGPAVCNATLVLTACSPNGVVIAADGLTLKPDANPPSTAEACKIMRGTDTCFFSIVGVQDIRSIDYDLVPMADHACKGNGSMVERAKAFEKIALPEVQRAWSYIKAHEPASYALMRRSGPASVCVVFAGGPPFTVVIVQYVEDASGRMTIDKSIIDVSNFASESAYENVGVSENVELYQRQHREIEKLNDAGFLRGLLLGAIQLEGKPKRIGPPIAILEINGNGPKWIQRGACAEIKHRQTNPQKKSRVLKVSR